MIKNQYTTDQHGFDYMDNNGQEEKDRDTIGMLAAVAVIILLTVFQYLGLY